MPDDPARLAQADETLLAAPFDPGRPEITGDVVPFESGVIVYTGGAAQFDVAASGTLVYRRTTDDFLTTLVILDRGGNRIERLPLEPSTVFDPRYSPDGSRIVMGIQRGSDADIWMYDVAQQSTSVVTEAGINVYGAWTPDGRRIVFSSNSQGQQDLFWVSGALPGEPEVLVDTRPEQWASSFSPLGPTLFCSERKVTSSIDIMAMTVGDTVRSVLETSADEVDPAVSPDGRWLAYASDETGVSEVYVVSADGDGRHVSVSRGGGGVARWASGTGEIFYIAGDTILVAARYVEVPEFEVVSRDTLFAHPNLSWGAYDVHPDGDRFVLVDGRAPSPRVIVVRGVLEELRRVPGR